MINWIRLAIIFSGTITAGLSLSVIYLHINISKYAKEKHITVECAPYFFLLITSFIVTIMIMKDIISSRNIYNLIFLNMIFITLCSNTYQTIGYHWVKLLSYKYIEKQTNPQVKKILKELTH